MWPYDRASSETDEPFVPIFLERYVLPTLAAITVGVILLNPFKLSRLQQAEMAILVLVCAFLIGHWLHQRNMQTRKLSSDDVKQQSFGPNSPNIIGHHNTVGTTAEGPIAENPNGKKPT
jgi:hypothetical protein